MPQAGKVTVRQMLAADLPFGVHLKDQAGWNQTTADIERFLALQPNGCFVAEFDGRPAGTVATFVFGPVAWIAFVLVESELRGQGIGQALMRKALEFIDEQKVPTARLDATPLGQPLYEKLGFVAEFKLARFEGKPTSVTGSVPGISPGKPEHFDAIVALDRKASGAERTDLLRRLIDEQPSQLRVVTKGSNLTGFVLSRPGSRATMIGPCVASNDCGLALLDDSLSQHAGEPVFVDIPLGQTAAIELAKQRGLTVQRELLRMRRGPALVEIPDIIWASSGPEKG
jgi:GNAT superfamily N-acetyltransferase